MRFQPLIVWWLLIPLILVGLAAFGWQLMRLKKAKKQELMPWIRRSAIFVLLALVALGPSVPGGASSPGVANLDVVIAVDTTSSMGAQDYNGGELRIDGAKRDMLALAQKLKGAHFAIVTFDSKANVVLPFTADGATFNAAVQAVNREIYGTSKGSAIDKPLEVVSQQLKNSKAAHPERSRLLFYLGDGEQTDKNPAKPFDDLDQYVDGGAVLGYGTAEGAKMLRNTGLQPTKAEPQYVNMLDPATKKFVPAVSKLDESALKKIAEQTGTTYQNRNKGEPIDEVYKVSNAQLLTDNAKKITHYLNLYWLFAIPLVVLLFWEWKKVLLLILELRKYEKRHHA